LLAKAKMRPILVVVGKVFVHRALQMSFA
jgi:hypothetical protein